MAQRGSSSGRMEQLARDGWKWMVRGYYGPGGRRGTKERPNQGRIGEREGDLALETVHKSDEGKDIEVNVFRERPDIDKIEIIELQDE